MTRRRRNPEELTPGEAIQRWLDRKRSEIADATLRNYAGHLKLWREWCEDLGIETVADLRPADFDAYKGHRSQYAVNVTLKKELRTLQQFVGWLDKSLDAVEDDLAEAIDLPKVDRDEMSNETVLAPEDAAALLDFYRNDAAHYGTRDHVVLELAWITGARRGALRGLDIRDIDLEDGFVDFVHRPQSDTPLKNKIFGQRSVSISPEVVAAIERYLEHHRYEVHDGEGRQPLLASRVGRPKPNTVTGWAYGATQPCLYTECPHGKERESCEYTDYNHASKCPSSRSPHPMRSGSITWQLNCGVPPEVVAGRVNASIEIVRWHYDWATESQRWKRLHEHRQQRQQYLSNLTIEA